MQTQSAMSAPDRLLAVAKDINRAALIAHLPASLLVELFIDDAQTKSDIMQVLRQIEIMSGAPVLQQKRQEGFQTLQQAPNRMQALPGVGMDIGQEQLIQATPMIERILLNILSPR